MKRLLTTAIIAAFIASAGATVGCARKPKPETSATKIQHFFEDYGKKYPDTVYGRHPVEDVEVLDQTELHKHLISTEAYLSLENGDLQKIAVTFERRLRWKIVSWERLL